MELLEPGYERKKLLNQIVWFGIWFGVTLTGAVLTPDKSGHGTHQQLGLPPCPSVLFFDRPCPGCGLTTSWTAFIHGHFAEAFHAHPLGPIAYMVFTATAFISLYGYVKGLKFRSDSVKFTQFINWGLGAFVVFGIARMVMSPHFATDGERRMSSFVQKR